MTPKRAAIVVALAAIPVLVTSVVFLPAGGVVSLLAAVGLALSLAGIGLALLWATRSSWAPEPAPAARTFDRAAAQRRTRRGLQVEGWIGVIGGLGLLALVLGLDDDERSAVRFGALAVGLLILGAVSIVVARATGRAKGEQDAVSDDEPVPSGWILVSRRDRGSLLVFALPGLFAVLWGAWQFVPFFLLSLREGPTLLAATLGLAGVAVVGAGAVWAVRLIPDVWVDAHAARVRVGAHTASAGALTAARVSATAMMTGGSRSLFLILEGPGKLRVPLLLRRRGELAMTPAQRRAAVALVEAAAIELPRAKEDPRGKFSRTLYPTHLDAAQAREIVARPPRSDQDLPVTVG
ncbi:hypothetical protein SAMN04487848_2042 [Microbacterium sp. ru370.1]|uniref:hypothetical protein n=1 Tax=unclassified Microbacterium TaxID=2609290 RepID=UPI000885B11B|nr:MULTISPECIES: hypothetical protein [unclassified Microbacterium]SDO77411.1 hypothetical protein SAMN04487848_2042 [Microbacterium sp. ru370.1]SIT88847.1 hypothetical protein SAMN05880579_2037 [Microbacterium sp. RU1D]